MSHFAFIGAGQMARAIIQGLLAKSSFGPEAVACLSKSGNSSAQLAQETGILCAKTYEELLDNAAVCVLACKPQQLDELEANLPELTAGKLIVSILAGTTLKTLRSKFPQARGIVRTMPNLPIRVGAGLTPFAIDKPLSDADTDSVKALFESSGKFFEVPEDQIDAITTISGCGPAYFYKVVAAVARAGESLGIDQALAQSLAKETFVGAARLSEAVDTPADELAEQVRSKKGVTDAALNILEANELDAIFAEAIRAAKERACVLADNTKSFN